MMKILLLLCCLIAVYYGLPAEFDKKYNGKQQNIEHLYTDNGEDNDTVLVDGDILLSKEQAAIYHSQGWNGLVNSQAWIDLRKTGKWRIPIRYTVNPSLSRNIKRNIKKSINEFKKHTCVRFKYIRKPSDTNGNYIAFETPRVKGQCATSYNGKPQSRQYPYINIRLSDGCAGGGLVMIPAHEIMHALGRYHEHNRPDRNDYITVNPHNSCPDDFKRKTFAKIPTGLGYDYFSIMHYTLRSCLPIREKGNTFKIKERLTPQQIKKVGQLKMFSANDIMHIKRNYCPNSVLRLQGGEGPYEGRIEVNSDKGWGTVCSDGFDIKDARVFCSYLRYPGVEKMYTAGGNVKYMTENIPVWMSNLKCTGEEFSPFDCQQSQFGHHQCTHDQDVVIKCSKAARLVGDSDNSGRLEVYHKDQWGSVCSNEFGYKEAKIACGMMGYSRPVRAFTVEKTAVSSDTDDKVIISGIKCDGTEDHLSSCNHEDECINSSPIHLTCN